MVEKGDGCCRDRFCVSAWVGMHLQSLHLSSALNPTTGSWVTGPLEGSSSLTSGKRTSGGESLSSSSMCWVPLGPSLACFCLPFVSARFSFSPSSPLPPISLTTCPATGVRSASLKQPSLVQGQAPSWHSSPSERRVLNRLPRAPLPPASVVWWGPLSPGPTSPLRIGHGHCLAPPLPH